MPSDISNTDAAGNGTNGEGSSSLAAPIYFSLQYIKDLSFENPRAPEVYNDFKEPEVSVNVNVAGRNLAERTFEVVLRLSVEARADDQTTFLIELEYAGIAQVGPQIEEENIQPLVLIEGPRLLYPFARSIVANLTRDAAYPLLLMGHKDFVQMYRDGIEQAQQVSGPPG